MSAFPRGKCTTKFPYLPCRTQQLRFPSFRKLHVQCLYFFHTEWPEGTRTNYDGAELNSFVSNMRFYGSQSRSACLFISPRQNVPENSALLSVPDLHVSVVVSGPQEDLPFSATPVRTAPEKANLLTVPDVHLSLLVSPARAFSQPV